EQASGGRWDRPELHRLLDQLREGDVVVVWKLDRLGRSLRHLVNTAHELNDRGVGFKVLEGEGAVIDTSTTIGKAMFGFFGIMAELERDLNRERTLAGLAAARARGRIGGRRPSLTKSQVRQAQAAIAQPETVVSKLAAELGVTPPTLYRYVGPKGELREQGRAVLQSKKS
ncbi:MAG: recombinase family protein, partial [Planctomycetota bacterium]